MTFTTLRCCSHQTQLRAYLVMKPLTIITFCALTDNCPDLWTCILTRRDNELHINISEKFVM